MIERFMFFVTHSINDLRVNRQRTLFALLCIAAGVATIVSLQTLAVMINDTLTGSLQESNRGDLRLNPTGNWGTNTTELEESLSGTVFTPQGVEFLRNWFDEHYPGTTITYRQPLAGFGVGWSVFAPKQDTDKTFILSFIVEAGEYPVYGEVTSIDGESLDDLLREPTDVVLGQNLAEDLEVQVGDIVRISGATPDFTVRGIVDTGTEAGFRNSGAGFLAGLFGFYYLDTSATPLFEGAVPGQADELYIRLDDPSQVDEAQERLTRQFRALSVSSTTDLKEQNTLISARVDDLVIVMGLVSLLIGGIGIINTMLVIVSRRTNEVAVLKTLGLQPVEITVLFMVEAVIMGFVGSLAGILLGWGLAFLTKGFAETFLGQTLSFTVALRPALAGISAGLAITTVFGFLPTLAAAQIRPATVLRPSDTVIPKTGRLSAFVAMVVLIVAMSVLAQGLMGDLLESVPSIDTIVTIMGAAYGLLMAVPLVLSDFLSMRARRRGRSWILHVLVWPVLLVGLVAAGAVFGRNIPALLVLTATAILIGYLYLLFWFIIWAAGGGKLGEIRGGIMVLAFPAFWPLIPVLIVLVLPVWILGLVIQRFAFVDLKLAMRGMLSTKGRGASTLLALVIGIFTLSVITMLVDSITKAFESLLEDVTGGNVLVFTASASNETMAAVRAKLDEERASLRSFSMVASYEAQLTDYWDARQERTLTGSPRNSLRDWLNPVDGRDITSNLPDLTLIDGRNLDPARDSQPNAQGFWPAVVQRPQTSSNIFTTHEVQVGDRLTLAVGRSPARGEVKLVVVGVAEEVEITAGSDAHIYAPLAAFAAVEPNEVLAVADVKESDLRQVRRSLAEVPGTFVIETRFINDLVNRLVDQFTSFPTLVAALALFTGGFVIANSVALSTMERRREIGVMKAVGLQRERVLAMLLLENGLMGVIGGLIGVGISFVILVIILYQMFQGELGNKVPYGIALALMGLCIAISLIAAAASVWTASGERPLNTLRYE